MKAPPIPYADILASALGLPHSDRARLVKELRGSLAGKRGRKARLRVAGDLARDELYQLAEQRLRADLATSMQNVIDAALTFGIGNDISTDGLRQRVRDLWPYAKRSAESYHQILPIWLEMKAAEAAGIVMPDEMPISQSVAQTLALWRADPRNPLRNQ